MPHGPRIRLEFVPEPDDRPWPVRVRQVLKFAKRAQALKCVAAEEVAAAGPQPDQAGADATNVIGDDGKGVSREKES
jgi:hypothetical protein